MVWCQPNYHTTKYFSKKLLTIEMNKISVKMNKPLCLGLLFLNIRKIPRYDYWYDYVKEKYGQMVKLCYMDIDSFVVHEKSENIYAYFVGDVKKRFDISNYEVKNPLPTGNDNEI